MSPEDAFDFINSRFLEQQKSLNECEKDVILGIWEGKTYQRISEEINITCQHAKDTGANLNKKLTKIFKIEINKRNLKPAIESLYNQQDRNPRPSQESSTELTNSASQQASEPSEINDNNPFIPQQGRVDDPQLFFNREREIWQIFEVLSSGSSIALIGEEGIGKSSLLRAICRQAENCLQPPRKPVFLDLNWIHDEDDFYSALCDEIGIPESRGYRLTRNLRQHRLLLAVDNVGKMTWEGFTRGVRDYLRGLAWLGAWLGAWQGAWLLAWPSCA